MRGFFFGSLEMTMTEVIDDSDSGLARLLTPSGPRCGLKRDAFDQASIEYRALVKAAFLFGCLTRAYTTSCYVSRVKNGWRSQNKAQLC